MLPEPAAFNTNSAMQSGPHRGIKSLASLMLERGILKRVAAIPAEKRQQELRSTRLLYFFLTYLAGLATAGTAAVCVAFIYLYVLHPLHVELLSKTEIALCIGVFVILTIWFAFLAVVGAAMRNLLEEHIVPEAGPSEKL